MELQLGATCWSVTTCWAEFAVESRASLPLAVYSTCQPSAISPSYSHWAWMAPAPLAVAVNAETVGALAGSSRVMGASKPSAVRVKV